MTVDDDSRGGRPMTTSRRRLLQGAGSAALLAELAGIRRLAHAAVGDHGDRDHDDRIAPSDYSLDPSVTYLNHASIGTVPRVVQAAHRGYLELCETNPWLYMWSDPWREPLEGVRAAAAGRIGCAVEELAIVHNTTEFFNMLALGLPIGRGDEVLFSSLNHAGASVCWEHQSSARGYTVRRFEWPIEAVPEMDEDAVVELYERQIGPRTAVVVLPHVDNMVGLRHPVGRIAAAARRRGVRWILVDGAQTVHAIPVDVGGFDIDAYVTSAHKWTQAPKGLGFAYVRRDAIGEIRPMWVTWGQKIWPDDARMYEDYGTRALPAVLALGDALAFQARVDAERREARHRQTWLRARERVDAAPGLRWRSPTSWSLSAPLFAVQSSAAPSEEVAQRLYRDHGVVVRPFHTSTLDALRISPNLINGAADVERCLSLAQEG